MKVTLTQHYFDNCFPSDLTIMALDANFAADDSLRLTSFLRVVEHGMPRRPSRFKQRIQIASEQSHASVSELSIGSPLLTAFLEIRDGSSAHNTNISNFSGHSSAMLQRETQKDVEVIQTQSNIVPKPAIRSGCIDNLLWQSTLPERHSIFLSDRNRCDYAHKNQLHFNLPSIDKSAK